MTLKCLGAVFILISCGYTGFSINAGYRRQERVLRQLLHAINYMSRELSYSLLPLPELCKHCAEQSGGAVKRIFYSMAELLTTQYAPDPYGCMRAALEREQLPGRCAEPFRRLGRCLGRYDLPGQLDGLREVKAFTVEALKCIQRQRRESSQKNRILGVCAGISLVILLV